ncbi:hypothetical protein EVAR_85302_1 [Eumeta japonica]|uniref:Uncharacterized protein n=1 Tax=Eumeta variegata TaxID=151549 RepID=A0A4C1V8F1_EUMVA|nr:hypothetical protein EVAR_85302_1 [Eumeta japonica]
MVSEEFNRGRVSLYDEIREGRSSTAITEENVATVRQLIEENRLKRTAITISEERCHHPRDPQRSYPLQRRVTCEEFQGCLGIGTSIQECSDLSWPWAPPVFQFKGSQTFRKDSSGDCRGAERLFRLQLGTGDEVPTFYYWIAWTAKAAQPKNIFWNDLPADSDMPSILTASRS